MSDPNEPADPNRRPVEKTPHEGPDVDDLEADNAVEKDTIETVDPDNAPA